MLSSFNIGMVETILYSALALVTAWLIFDSVRLRLKNRRFLKEIIQLSLNASAYSDKISNLQEELSVVESDGFLKFVSESREWAFDYIENVQKTIDDLRSAIDAKDQFLVTEAHEKLISFLPEEDKAKK
jgi:GH25 family lysozyme M1 (1,4-beta-N-acetylmuramidase)